MSTLVFPITIKKNGAPADADVLPVVSDGAAAYGIRRTDTNAVVVAAGKPLVQTGTGTYTYTLDGSDADHPAPIDGITYEAVIKATVNGEVYYLPKTRTAGADSWYYADQQDVEDLIGTRNVGIAFDLDDDGNLDADAVQRAGEWSDDYINLALRKEGLTAPNALTDETIAGVLKSASAHLTVWYGWHQRGIDDTMTPNQRKGIASIMSGYKQFADEQIASVVALIHDEDSDATFSAGQFQFVPIRRRCTWDENSRTICW